MERRSRAALMFGADPSEYLRMTGWVRLALVTLWMTCATARAAETTALSGTAALTMQGDIASQMVDGVDRFLMKQIERAAANREKFWQRDFSSEAAYEKSIAANRARLGQILGARDTRAAKIEMELVATVDRPALVGKSDAFEAYAVRWRAFGDVHGEGLLLKPIGIEPVADVVAIPDADQTPEMIAGLHEGLPRQAQYARSLAEMGCRVIVPVLISREVAKRAPAGMPGRAELSNREFIYRSAYELGRHVIGYEVEKVLAAVDWAKGENPNRPVGVFGWGEGGMIAFYAAALDTRIKVAGVSGYFGRREQVWREPIERNVFGLLERFGDAEVASLIFPRGLLLETSDGPKVKISGKGAAPALLENPIDPRSEHQRCLATLMGQEKWRRIPTLSSDPFHPEAVAYRSTLLLFFEELPASPSRGPGKEPQRLTKEVDAAERQARQWAELDAHNQKVLEQSYDVRREFMKKLDTSSIEKYEASVKQYRERFYNEVLGRFDEPLLPMNARTRKAYDTDKYVGYAVVLDVFPDVFAYGVLLLPKDLKEGERRPVVVCQHGLEGRPQDAIAGDSHFYRDFAAKLAEQGFITFAPQNLYIFGDRFRVLGRKANPLGKTIWSIIIPQHQQILNFLKGLPNVDARRIGFYGLSYGGKTAMRVPAVLTDYCLSICSGDFNEWVFKNATTTHPMSYVFSPEYEIFEWDLGSTFNYAEMAALIAPRPFMVERGHFDGVSTDEYVAFEFAKVRRLYNGQLKIGDRCAIEFFDGPHTINGKGTFEFLHKQLDWEKR